MKKQSGVSLISMLVVIVIIAIAYYFISSGNLSTVSLLDKKTKKALKDQGIKTDNYSEMIDSAKSKVDEINKKIKEQQKKMEEF